VAYALLTYGGKPMYMRRDGGRLPIWRPSPTSIVTQRHEGTGTSTLQDMGSDGWETMDVPILYQGTTPLEDLMALRGRTPRTLHNLPHPGGGVSDVPNVYLEQVGPDADPLWWVFASVGLTEFPVRFRRLSTTPTGSPGSIGAVPGTLSGSLAAPTGVSAHYLDSTTLEIDWTDTNTVEQGYEVQYSDDAGATWMIGGFTGQSGTLLVVDGVDNTRTYTIRVRAYDSGGFGPWSATVTI
jgi:hypothetical protein